MGARYVLIESKGPLDGGEYAFELGRQLRELNHEVTVFLVQDAVFTARRTHPEGTRLRELAAASGLVVRADGFCLRERGVTGDRVADGIQISDMDDLVDLLMSESDKAIWH